jgi:BirA family biotin operon repressor/biotin-[acetyl-CoA-carboxylase] ligase
MTQQPESYLTIVRNYGIKTTPATMRRIGIPFNIIDSVDSTNRLALERVTAGSATSGEVFFAMEQFAGRGQRGKKWSAESGMNIIMSMVLEPEGWTPADMFQLNCAAALAATDLFSRYAGDETSVKWPNDIYWRNRKAGGILIENIMRGRQWRWAVVGFGININQTMFDPGLPNPVSLRQITGKVFDPVELARELCSDLRQHLEALTQSGFQTRLDLYQQRLYGKGRWFILQHQNATFRTLIKGVDADGKLITGDVETRKFRFGEVSWIGPA